LKNGKHPCDVFNRKEREQRKGIKQYQLRKPGPYR